MLFWTNPGNKILQNCSYTVIYPHLKNQDEQDIL